MDEKNINSQEVEAQDLPEDEACDNVMTEDRDEYTCEQAENVDEYVCEQAELTDENNDLVQKTKRSLLSVVEYVEIFAVAVFAVLFIFSFMFRICIVDGASMNNTLQSGERLLTTNFFYTPEGGDIIVFYENDPLNKPLVKRVIATEGQTVEINYIAGTVKVDGVLLDEDYVYLSDGYYKIFPNYVYDNQTKTMTVTVPDGQLFVMGDNRNDSWDSRSYDIGCITEQQIMGKVICRISPYTAFN